MEPSAAAALAVVSATKPLPPDWLSITIVWPRSAASFYETNRSMASGPLPGENGVMMRIGLDGNGCAATILASPNQVSWVKARAVSRAFVIMAVSSIGCGRPHAGAVMLVSGRMIVPAASEPKRDTQRELPAQRQQS